METHGKSLFFLVYTFMITDMTAYNVTVVQPEWKTVKAVVYDFRYCMQKKQIYHQFDSVKASTLWTIIMSKIAKQNTENLFPGGWRYYDLVYYDEALSWFEALEMCENRGMTLTRADYNRHLTYIKSVLGGQTITGDMWTSGYKHVHSSRWFPTHTDCDREWYPTISTAIYEEEQCMVIPLSSQVSFKRRAEDCEQKFPYLCIESHETYYQKSWYVIHEDRMLSYHDLPIGITIEITTQPSIDQCIIELLKDFGRILAVYNEENCTTYSFSTSRLPLDFQLTFADGFSTIVKKELNVSIDNTVTNQILTKYSSYPCPHPNPLTTSKSTSAEQITQDGTTDEQITQGVTTGEPTTQGVTTGEPITQGVTTGEQITQGVSTGEPTTQDATTGEPITQGLTTGEPVTQSVSTGEPITQDVTTGEQITQGVTTGEPITQGVTTGEPITQSVSTGETVSQGVTTGELITQSVNTGETIAQGVTTGETVTQCVITGEQITQGVTTDETITQSVSTGEPMTVSVTAGEMSDGNGLESSTSVRSNTTLKPWCQCSCKEIGNLTEGQLQKKLKEMKEKLSISKGNLSSVKRSKVSAHDPRTSVQSAGYLATAILVVVSALFVVIDMSNALVFCLK